MRTAGSGYSMLPAIFPGDTLEIRRIAFDHARVGDIALVACAGCTFAHRIVREEFPSGRRLLVTHGDAMESEDCTPVSEKEFLGCVECIVRSGRRVQPEINNSAFATVLRTILRRWPRTRAAMVRLHSLRERFARGLADGRMRALPGDVVD